MKFYSVLFTTNRLNLWFLLYNFFLWKEFLALDDRTKVEYIHHSNPKIVFCLHYRSIFIILEIKTIYFSFYNFRDAMMMFWLLWWSQWMKFEKFYRKRCRVQPLFRLTTKMMTLPLWISDSLLSTLGIVRRYIWGIDENLMFRFYVQFYFVFHVFHENESQSFYTLQ